MYIGQNAPQEFDLHGILSKEMICYEFNKFTKIYKHLTYYNQLQQKCQHLNICSNTALISKLLEINILIYNQASLKEIQLLITLRPGTTNSLADTNIFFFSVYQMISYNANTNRTHLLNIHYLFKIFKEQRGVYLNLCKFTYLIPRT